MKLLKKVFCLGLILTYMSSINFRAEALGNVKSSALGSNKITVPANPNLGVVSASSLIVRSGPTTSSKVIGGLRYNANVNIISLQSGWYKIKYNNGYGFVSSDYVKSNFKVDDSKGETSSSGSAAVNNSNQGVVTSSSLIVRSGPSTAAKAIGGLRNSDKINIISLETGWYKIKYNNSFGYVSSAFIKTSFNPNSSEKQTGYVTASALNMRSGAGINYSIVKIMKKGESVAILEQQQDWMKVSSNTVIGWVLGSYISNSQPMGNPVSVNRKTIILDAGHGGYDPGAIGPTGLREKSVTLAVTLKLGEILEKQGHTVIYTRKSDEVPWISNEKDDLKARVDIGINSKADLFISIHTNSSILRYPNGMETYYTDTNSENKQLAQSIQDSMVKGIDLVNRGIKKDNFYVIKNSTAVSALVELAYISNKEEEQVLSDSASQDKWAEAIAKGINNYLNTK